MRTLFSRITLSVGVLGLTAALLGGCTTEDPAPTPTTGQPSSAQPTPDQSPSAQALAAEILASPGKLEPPTEMVKLSTGSGANLQIGVRSLVTTATHARLELVVAAPTDDGGFARVFGVEEFAAWRDLHQLSVRDNASTTRYYPYRYAWLPGSAKFGTTSSRDTYFAQGQVYTLGAILLPPLPEKVTTVDVLLPYALTTNEHLATDPVAVIKDVPVVRE